MKKIKTVYSLQFTVYSLMAALLIAPAALYGQDQTPAPSANQDVRNTFEYGVAINNQTVESLSKNSLGFIIQHRFGVIDNSFDLYGIYAPANIRLGLDYGITSRFSVGVGATKDNQEYDLQWKYVLLRQQKPGGMPVTVTYYGDLARSGAQDNSLFLNEDSVYKGANRISYFNELMVARKVTDHISLQVGFTYTHFNLVDSIAGLDNLKDHDFFGGAFVGKYRFSPQSSVLVDCNVPFKQRTVTTTDPATSESYPKINLGIGIEVSTGGHQFQVFVCNADQILNQEIAVYNENTFSSKNILVGFNITRQWGLK